LRGFETLDIALSWVIPRWQERPVPIRLHDWDTDGIVGLRYSAAFGSLLDSHSGQTTHAERTMPCSHGMRRPGELCPSCSIRDVTGRPIVESGVITTSSERYKFPMLRAFERLDKDLPTRPHFPSPSTLVVLLSVTGWDARRSAEVLGLSWEVAEPLLLMALRKLFHYYQEGPIPNRVPYSQRSESQLRAESEASPA
jgi:hypothetical protein